MKNIKQNSSLVRRGNNFRRQLNSFDLRIQELTEWLNGAAPEIEEQRHLDEKTSEQIYWHYGYVCALKDVVALLTSTEHVIN